MTKRLPLFLLTFVLLPFILACGTQTGTLSSDELATVVAATMQALTSSAPETPPLLCCVRVSDPDTHVTEGLHD